jgi:DNA-binding MarR family transcriptional regulator
MARPGVLSSVPYADGTSAKSARISAFGDGMPHPEQLVALAVKIGESRDRRQKFFADELFAEPGWEMLLALYRADAAGLRMSVSNLCGMTCGPETTAVRWIDRLEGLGMISRRKNPSDGRDTFVELSAGARSKIHDYLVETWVYMGEAITSGTREK